MRLIPTVELEPGQYAAEGRPCPASADPDAAWDAWFLTCLADAGIHELRPIRSRSWLVAIDHLVQPRTIERIFTAQFEVSLSEAAGDPEQWGPLRGGYALQRGAELLVEPGCCGDLGNLSEWHRAVDAADDSWASLWIGHPWRSARRTGAQVEISQPHQNAEGGVQQPLVVACRVDAAELAHAVEAARGELAALAARIRPLVAPHATEAAAFLRCLVGLDRGT